jgi:hypothetical protein
MAMTHKLRTRKELAFIVVIVALACAATSLTFELTYPKPFLNAALGAEWQCSKTLIMTSCTRVAHVSPVLDRPLGAPACLRRHNFPAGTSRAWVT